MSGSMSSAPAVKTSALVPSLVESVAPAQLPALAPSTPASAGLVPILIRRLETTIRFRGVMTAPLAESIIWHTGCWSGVTVALSAAALFMSSGQPLETKLLAPFLSGALGALVFGGLAALATGITKSRPLDAGAFDFMRDAHASASDADKALLSELAATWMRRLDARKVRGFEARDVLREVADAQVSPDLRLEAKNVVGVLDSMYVATAEDTTITPERSRALIGQVKRLSDDQRKLAGAAFRERFFKANGGTRVDFGDMSHAVQLELLLRHR